MFSIEKITEEHLNDWLDMMMLLWDDNSYEVLKVEHISALNSEKHGNFICIKDGVGIGFVNMSLRHDYVSGADSSPVGYVEGIFVRSEYRHMGIARKLLAAGEQWAKEKGAQQIGSDSLIENHGAINFHKSVGFTEVERVSCFIKSIK